MWPSLVQLSEQSIQGCVHLLVSPVCSDTLESRVCEGLPVMIYQSLQDEYSLNSLCFLYSSFRISATSILEIFVYPERYQHVHIR